MTRIAVLASALALTACLADPADPELATVDEEVVLAGHQIGTAETAVDTLHGKQLIAACPAGTRALGAGWAALDRTGAFLRGVATYSAPSWDGASWMVNVSNVSSWESSWKLHLRVICARVTGYEILTRDSAFNTVGSKYVDLTCPTGKRATGAGFGVLDATDAILIGEASYFLPSWDGTGWLIRARHRGFFSSWKLRGFLVCSDATSLPGFQPVTVTSALGTISIKQVTAACPGQKVATSAGWAVLDPTSAILDGAALTSAASYDGRSWTTNATVNSSFAPRWKLRATALCVD